MESSELSVTVCRDAVKNSGQALEFQGLQPTYTNTRAQRHAHAHTLPSKQHLFGCFKNSTEFFSDKIAVETACLVQQLMESSLGIHFIDAINSLEKDK